MTDNYASLDELFKYGKQDQDFATFLSFIQVEYGLAYLKEQWDSFTDYSSIIHNLEPFIATESTYKEFAQALGELYLTNPG